MAAIVVATYAGIVWTLRRGFDWTDESFVYTMIASNRIAVDAPLGFQHLLHPLYILTGESVLVFRIMRLLGYVLLSASLVASARYLMHRLGLSITRSGWVFILLLAQIGTFFAWSYPPRYLSYNELSSWFVQLGIVLILMSLVLGRSSREARPTRWVLWSVWAGLGVVTTLLMFAKISSAVAFGVFLALVLVLPNPFLRLWGRVVAASAGAAAVLLALWASGGPIVPYFTHVSALVFDRSAQASYGHPISGMIQASVGSVLSAGYHVFPAVLLFTLLVAVVNRTAGPHGNRAGQRSATFLAWFLAAPLVISLMALPKADVWAYVGALVFFVGTAGSIGLAILGAGYVTKGGSTVSRWLSVAAGGFAILAAPFISAIGTNNGIVEEFIFAATLWAVVLGVALVLLAQRATLAGGSAGSLPVLIGCTLILLAGLAVKVDIAKPYRNPPLLSQGTPTSVPELRGLLLAKPDAAWIDWISAAGASLGGDGVPGTATGSPGALYAFDHSGYASPWVGSEQQGPYVSLSSACATERPAHLFVLQPDSSVSTFSSIRLAASLSMCGIRFPGDFAVAARRVSRDPARGITIWRLKSVDAPRS